MGKIKIGVLGLYRGSSMINYCLAADNAELVAICDKWVEGVELQKKKHPDILKAFALLGYGKVQDAKLAIDEARKLNPYDFRIFAFDKVC